MRLLRIRKSLIPMALCSICTILLLLSDVCFYLRITSSSLFPGIMKTALYAGICFSALWLLVRKRTALDLPVKIFLAFTCVTMFATACGVATDIALWRQIIHLTFFAAAFVASYLSTQHTDMRYTKKYLLLPLWLITFLFILAVLTRGIHVQNAVYYLVMFLPVLSLIRSKSIRIGMSVLMALFTLLSNKRTMLIAVVAYFLVYELLSNKRQTRRIFISKVIIYMAGCFGLYFVFPKIVQMLGISVFRELEISHIVEDGGSNRVFIYGMLWARQSVSSLRHWLIGDGFNAVLFSRICTDGILGEWVSAHNDFLEVLYDYGIIGLTLYLAFLGILLRKGLQMIRSGRIYGYAFFCSIIMVLIISMSSHLIIYLNYYVIFFIFWGMCLADHMKEDRMYEVNTCSQ